jgi:hypothetical protein
MGIGENVSYGNRHVWKTTTNNKRGEEGAGGYTLLVRAQLTTKQKRRRKPGAHVRVPWKWCVFVNVVWCGV